MIVSAQEAEALAGWSVALTLRTREVLERTEYGTPITRELITHSPECEGMFNTEVELGETASKLIFLILEIMCEFSPELIKKAPQGTFISTRRVS